MIKRIQKATARSISTKYSLLFALLVNVTVTVVLVSAGTITLSQSEAVRYQVQEAVIKAQQMSEEKELRRTGAYLSHRLQAALSKGDIGKLNEQIEEIATWFPISSFLVLDRDGKVVTDGSENATVRGQHIALPPDFRQGSMLTTAATGKELLVTIGQRTDKPLGYAKILLAGSTTTESLQTLDVRMTELWSSYAAFLIGIGASAFALVLCLAVLLIFVLSRSLASPLHEMIRAAKNYASGNLDVQLSVRSDDELGQLAQSLNTMAAELKRTGSLLSRAQEIANLGSWEWDGDNRRLNWSRQALRILGFHHSTSKLAIKTLLFRITRSDRRRIIKLFRPPISAESFNLDIGFHRTDGAYRLLRVQGHLIDDHSATGQPFWTGTLQDVTERRADEDKLNFLANYDALTGLPNRHLFQHRLQEAILHAKRQQTRLALLFLDLDRFKGINDALGHAVGDDVLKLAAMRLRQTLRDSDTVARLGGDEFTIILERIGDQQDVVAIAQRVVNGLSESFALAGERELCTSCSVGITLYPDDGADVTTLLKNADVAMYESKALGRGQFRFYTPEMNREAEERLTIENQLRSAIRNKNFALYYQPQLAVATGELCGVEALLRWRTEFGLIPPDKFIPILEDSGMIQDLSCWILEHACRQIRDWADAGLGTLRMAVNLSARQLQQPDMASMIDDILRETEVAPRNLEIEITESVLLDPTAINPNARELVDMGIRLTIDDFGTGYCALSYLKQLSVDCLKIDRSFIHDIPNDQDDLAISEAIINLSKSLGLQVVAEGVETVEQWEFLKQKGCDLMQGFIISKPLSGEEFITWLRSNCRQVGDKHFWQARTGAPDGDATTKALPRIRSLSIAG